MGPALKWHFVAMAGDGEQQLTTVTSRKVSATSKALQFAEAILQRTFKANDEFTPADLYSEICDLVVTVKDLDNGNQVNRIEQILPHPKKKVSVPKKPDPVLDGENMVDDDVPF